MAGKQRFKQFSDAWLVQSAYVVGVGGGRRSCVVSFYVTPEQPLAALLHALPTEPCLMLAHTCCLHSLAGNLESQVKNLVLFPLCFVLCWLVLQANVGDPAVDGDGVTPISAALLPGAQHLVLPDVYHNQNQSPGCAWYGTREVVEQWDKFLP